MRDGILSLVVVPKGDAEKAGWKGSKRRGRRVRRSDRKLPYIIQCQKKRKRFGSTVSLVHAQACDQAAVCGRHESSSRL